MSAERYNPELEQAIQQDLDRRKNRRLDVKKDRRRRKLGKAIKTTGAVVGTGAALFGGAKTVDNALDRQATAEKAQTAKAKEIQKDLEQRRADNAASEAVQSGTVDYEATTPAVPPEQSAYSDPIEQPPNGGVSPEPEDDTEANAGGVGPS